MSLSVERMHCKKIPGHKMLEATTPTIMTDIRPNKIFSPPSHFYHRSMTILAALLATTVLQSVQKPSQQLQPSYDQILRRFVTLGAMNIVQPDLQIKIDVDIICARDYDGHYCNLCIK